MIISIIVPTRDRAQYLQYCLQTCLASDDKDIEVIVSDNNSSDDTREVVSRITDSRLRYFNTGESVSMRKNFEFALGHATGDYIIFIGDDDGVLKNGISTLRFLIEQYQPDVVGWRHITYKWPRTQPIPENGVLKFRYRDFFGPLHNKDPKQVLSQICSAKLVNYREGANIYHGCVSRHVINKLKEKTGEYFQAHSPDVYAAIANLSVAKSFLWVRNPITIGGESEKSNGTAMTSKQHQTKSQVDIASSFMSLAEADEVTPELDLRIRSVIAIVYASLNRVNKIILNGRLTIDHEAWRRRILNDAGQMPSEFRKSNSENLQAFFGEVDPAYISSVAVDTVTLMDNQTLPTDADHHRVTKKKKRHKIDERHTETVASASAWIDAVTGMPHLPQTRGWFAAPRRLGKIVRMALNAGRIN